jgi:hypothetical protein
MRHASLVASLFASLFFVIPAFTASAQTQNPKAKDDSAFADRIAAARSAYALHRVDAEADDPESSGNETLAQLSRRRPVPRSPQRGPRPRPVHAGMWAEPGNARGTLIGASVGFGLGAALGARGNTDQHPGAGVKAAVLFGAFGALIGGHGPPAFRARNFSPSTATPGEQEDASGPKLNSGKSAVGG